MRERVRDIVFGKGEGYYKGRCEAERRSRDKRSPQQVIGLGGIGREVEVTE